MCKSNKSGRSLKVVSPFVAGDGIIRITEQGVSKDYAVSVAPHATGDVVDMIWTHGEETSFTSLDGIASSCSCHWGEFFSDYCHCKHVAAGLKLLDLGLIQPTVDVDQILEDEAMIAVWEQQLQEAY